MPKNIFYILHIVYMSLFEYILRWGNIYIFYNKFYSFANMHGILLVFCRIFPYENIPFTIFLNFISLFLIFLPLIFTIRELIDSYYIESIINLFLILIPHVIFLIYLKGKQI